MPPLIATALPPARPFSSAWCRFIMINIPRIEKPVAWPTRLSRVAILCSTCRLRNESDVSTFESDTRANLRLKLPVASMGLVLFIRSAAVDFPFLPSSSRGYSLQRETRRDPSKKIFRIPKILKADLVQNRLPGGKDVDPVALTNRNGTGRIVQGIGDRPSGNVILVAGLAIAELEDECERNDARKSAAEDDFPAGVHQ